MEDTKRIYIVVAQTVQEPISMENAGDSHALNYRYTSETRSIIQPPGRMAAQAVHAGRMIENRRLLKEIAATPKPRRGRFLVSHPCPEITTIIKECRNSLELFHVISLLEKADIGYVEFFDTNPKAYGTEEKILTAIGTEPIDPRAVIGILDYLPLFAQESTIQLING